MNQYKLTTEHGVSQLVWAADMKTARADFEATLPGIKLSRIQLWK